MTAVTGDILALLDKLPIWKRIKETPARADALEGRIEALEKRLERAQGEACQKCGNYTMRLITRGRQTGSYDKAFTNDTWRCTECAHTEVHASIHSLFDDDRHLVGREV